jgi:type I restriction enzyme S subunit
MSYKRIGNYIRLVSNRNSDWAITNLLGVNIYKNFMPSVANTSGVDLSKYKIIRKGQFATNIMHVNRDEILPVALYQNDEPAIVSPAYMTFEVIDENELLPEFLMMEFQRPEFDRRAWTYCDSSVRGGLEWERFCDIEIPIPHIDEQRKFVALYNGLLTNQKTYENSLADLQLICNSSMDKLKHIDNHQPLSELVQLVDNRNKDNTIKNLLGINVDKVFMPSKANVGETDLSKYKIVQKEQFAYSAMQVGRDETVRVVLYSFDEPAIISPAYLVFEVIDKQVVIPEFLMLWFYRPEFNRYGWFISDSSVRASLEWERFKEIKIPIPDINVQEAIVTIYHTLETRKRINEQLKNTIKPLCPVLMRGVVESMKLETDEN